MCFICLVQVQLKHLSFTCLLSLRTNQCVFDLTISYCILHRHRSSPPPCCDLDLEGGIHHCVTYLKNAKKCSAKNNLSVTMTDHDCKSCFAPECISAESFVKLYIVTRDTVLTTFGMCACTDNQTNYLNQCLQLHCMLAKCQRQHNNWLYFKNWTNESNYENVQLLITL